jgi:hypothetical protein
MVAPNLAVAVTFQRPELDNRHCGVEGEAMVWFASEGNARRGKKRRVHMVATDGL